MTVTKKADRGADAPFPFPGDNLLLLMGLPAGCGVLAIGDSLDSWKGLFRNCCVSAHVPEQSPGTEPGGLILYHSTSSGTSRAFAADMKKAREILAENGSILVFAENPTSFGNLRKLKQGKLGTLLGKLRQGHTSYGQELQRAGFGDVRCYYPLPGLEQAEELVAVGSSLLELPHYWHPVLHAAKKLGAFRILTEGFVFHAGPFRLESGDLINRINVEVSRQSDRPGVRCVLERIDIRSRGALVLFLMDETTGDRLIARIVSDKKINEIVGKNHAFLDSIHNASEPSESFKKLLPRPLCRMEYYDSTIYVETMVEGTVAWKVNRKGLNENIAHEAITFILQLNRTTRNLKRLNDQDMDNVFRDDLSRLMNSDVIESFFRKKLLHLILGLKQQLRNQEVYLVASHGDYGYGNILVDPNSGELKGVIDWDTARKQDLPGVDLFNFYYQKERMEQQCGILTAFKMVVPAFISGQIGDSGNAYFEEFCMENDLKKIVIYLGFIRDVSRSAQYIEHFTGTQSEYKSIYAFLQEVLPL